MNKTEITDPAEKIQQFRETTSPPELEPLESSAHGHDRPEGWLEWYAWEPCTMTCAFGSQIRKRECSYENSCNGSYSEFRSCPFIACDN